MLVALGRTSVSVFLQLYIDQCSLLLKHILGEAMSASFPFPSWRAFKTFPVQEHQWSIYIQAVASRTMPKMVSAGLQGKAILLQSCFFVLLTFGAAASQDNSCLPALCFPRIFPIASSNVSFSATYSSHWNLQIGPESRIPQHVDRSCINLITSMN